MREGQGSAQEVQSLGRGIARKEMTATATAARSYPRRSTATDAAAAAAEVITTESARVLTEDIITAPATFLFKKYAFATIQRHLNKREKYQNRNVKLERKQDVVFIHTTENGRKNLVSSPSVEAVSQINTSVAPLRKSSAGKHQGQELSTLVRGAQGRVRKPLGCLTAEATIVGGGGDTKVQSNECIAKAPTQGTNGNNISTREHQEDAGWCCYEVICLCKAHLARKGFGSGDISFSGVSPVTSSGLRSARPL